MSQRGDGDCALVEELRGMRFQRVGLFASRYARYLIGILAGRSTKETVEARLERAGVRRLTPVSPKLDELSQWSQITSVSGGFVHELVVETYDLSGRFLAVEVADWCSGYDVFSSLCWERVQDFASQLGIDVKPATVEMTQAITHQIDVDGSLSPIKVRSSRRLWIGEGVAHGFPFLIAGINVPLEPRSLSGLPPVRVTSTM